MVQVLDSILRDGSGRGTQLHWSHLIDSLLVLLAQPMRLFLPYHDAVHAAAIAFGPLWAGGMGVTVAWAASPLAARRHLWSAAVVVAMSQPLISYCIPGVVHHHLPLALVVVMIAGWGHRALGAAPQSSTRAAGLALGAWSGLGIWLTPEAAPFVLLAFGFVWLGWLLAPVGPRASVVRMTAAGFALVVASAFAVDPPVDGGRWFVAFDRLSVVYLALAGCTLLAGLLTIPLARPPVAARLGRTGHFLVACAVGLVCLGIWFAAFPDLLRGAAGLVAPDEYAAMLGNIVEMQPLKGWADYFSFLFTGILGAGMTIVLAVRRPSVLSAAAAACAVLLAAAGTSHVRLTAYPAALAR